MYRALTQISGGGNTDGIKKYTQSRYEMKMRMFEAITIAVASTCTYVSEKAQGYCIRERLCQFLLMMLCTIGHVLVRISQLAADEMLKAHTPSNNWLASIHGNQYRIHVDSCFAVQ